MKCPHPRCHLTHTTLHSNSIIPLCPSQSPHYCSSEPVLIIQLWEAWRTDTVTPCGRLAANTNRRLWRWAASTRVKLPTLISWSGIKPDWENTTIPARQLEVSQHGGLKEKTGFCVRVFSEWKHRDLHITSNFHATSPGGPESPRTCSTPVR